MYRYNKFYLCSFIFLLFITKNFILSVHLVENFVKLSISNSLINNKCSIIFSWSTDINYITKSTFVTVWTTGMTTKLRSSPNDLQITKNYSFISQNQE